MIPAWVLVRALHLFFIAWMVWAPFSGMTDMILLHALTVPSLLVHWATNQDTCVLTLLETKLRGIESEDSFFYSLVAPVYLIPDTTLKLVVTGATLGLWAVSLKYVYTNRDKILDYLRARVRVAR